MLIKLTCEPRIDHRTSSFVISSVLSRTSIRITEYPTHMKLIFKWDELAIHILTGILRNYDFFMQKSVMYRCVF